MIDNYGIEKTFKIWELILMIDKPANVKKVKMFYRIEDIEKDSLLVAILCVGVDTVNKSFTLETFADAELYDDKSKEEAKDSIQFHLSEALERNLESKDYEGFWDLVDFEKGDWKKEGE